MIMADISKWIMLIVVIGIVVLLVKAGIKIINILIMVAVLAFCWFTFFTEVGAARLTIAIKGHPIIAYTTNLERQDNMSNNEVTYFRPDKEVIVNGQKQEYVKCYTKWIIRIPDTNQ